MRMTLWDETKSVPISKDQIWSAYKKVKANKGSAGIDSISMDEFDADRSGYTVSVCASHLGGFAPPISV